MMVSTGVSRWFTASVLAPAAPAAASARAECPIPRRCAGSAWIAVKWLIITRFIREWPVPAQTAACAHEK
jgi:hypothetical protein